MRYFIAFVMLCAVSCFAGEGKPEHKRPDRPDRPQRPEKGELVDKLFEKIDTDKDGKIDKEELKAAVRKFAEKHPEIMAKLREEHKEHQEEQKQN